MGDDEHALTDVTVADFSLTYPGPMATRILAQLGATVWKIEPPAGDPARGHHVFGYLNAGKAGLVVDLDDPEGRQAALALVDAAQVVVEGFRPGVMSRFGLGYEDLAARRPDLVYCSVSGFGQDGPHRRQPGHDLSYLALAGVLGRHRDVDGRPVLAPLPLMAADLTGGLLAAIGILGALHRRARTGVGAYLDVSLHDASLLNGAVDFASYLAAGGAGADMPTERSAHYRAFQTSDGRALALAIAPYEDRFWERFCVAVGLGQWAQADARQRQERAAELEQDIVALIATRTLDQWRTVLDPVDVPWAPLTTSEELARGDHIQPVSIPGDPAASVPIGIGETASAAGAPSLGADTAAVLAALEAKVQPGRLISDIG